LAEPGFSTNHLGAGRCTIAGEVVCLRYGSLDGLSFAVLVGVLWDPSPWRGRYLPPWRGAPVAMSGSMSLVAAGLEVSPEK